MSFFIGVVYRTNRRAYPSLMYSASELVFNIFVYFMHTVCLVVMGRNNVLMRLFELACLIDRRISIGLSGLFDVVLLYIRH